MAIAKIFRKAARAADRAKKENQKSPSMNLCRKTKVSRKSLEWVLLVSSAFVVQNAQKNLLALRNSMSVT